MTINQNCGLAGCSFTGTHTHGTDAKPQTECAHHRVVWFGGSTWLCDSCPQKFTPMGAEDSDPEVYETALDAIAGVMSAVMFDYTERMAERYGIKADDVRTDVKQDHDCEADGHVRDQESGICVYCQDVPFLGGGQ